MKLTIAIAAAVCCLPLTSSMLAPNDAIITHEAPRRDSNWYEGSIHTWSVEEDGTVIVALSTDKKPIWFRTPANQSSTTQFELLTLHACLALESKSNSARVRAEDTTELDGSSSEKAMRLEAIGRSR
tara:strand:- start:9583 stop:9963 length:381 start_codon:yes stop_codon:yes gene_type:complete